MRERTGNGAWSVRPVKERAEPKNPNMRRNLPPEHYAKMVAAKRAKNPPKPLAERYWPKVDKRGPDECWNWLGNKNPHGYGQMWPGKDRAKRYGDTIFAHHVALELAGIEVPVGMVRDHVCKNRACQNPAHIRLVPQTVNCTENSDSPHGKNSRKTECHKGHPLSGDNLRIVLVKPKGGKEGPRRESRVCLTCYRARRPGTNL